MSNAVVARALGEAQYEWVRGSDSGTFAVAERGDAGALAAATRQSPLALLIDGRELRLAAATIPAKARRQAALAAPFAVEDDVAEDLEALHVVCGDPQGDTGRRAVAVARLDSLRELLAPLGAAGVSVARMVPDCLALPYTPGHWSLLREDDRVLVRSGAQTGFAIETALLDALLARLDAAEYPSALDVYGETPVPAALSGLPVARHPLPQGALACLAGGATREHTLDLLPEAFRPRRGQRGLWVGGALLAAALVLHLGMLWRDTARLTTELDRVRAEQQQIMQTAFPEITRIVNAELQASQAVATLREQAGGGLSALDMLHTAGRALVAEEAGRFVLEGVNYADGVLNLRVRGPDVEALERFSAGLAGAVDAEVVTVEARPDGALASLRLQAPREAAP